MQWNKKHFQFLKLDYSSSDLSLFRVLFYSLVLIIGINLEIPGLFGAPEVFLFPVQNNFLYSFVISSANNYYILKSVFIVTGIFSLIGYGGRWVRFLTFASFTLLISSFTMYGIRSHRYCGIAFFLFALCCFDCSRHYSLESFLKSKKDLKPFPIEANTEFLLLQLYFFWFFFDAGLSKLMTGGFGWASENHIKDTISFFIFGPEEFFWYDMQVIIRDFFLNHPQLLIILGTAVMVFELLAPLGFIFSILTLPLVAVYLLMLIGFLTVMWLNFLVPMIPIFLIWVPFKKIKFYADKFLDA